MTKSKRQPYIKGGVASLRQPFFLGKIAKKIGKGLKKVVKSPLGKAALIGGGLYGLNRFGLGSSGIGKNWWSKALGRGAGKYLSSGAAGGARLPQGLFSKAMGGLKNFGYGKAALLGLGAAGMAAPFFAGKGDEEEEEEDWSITPSSIANIRNMTRLQDPSLAFFPNPE